MTLAVAACAPNPSPAEARQWLAETTPTPVCVSTPVAYQRRESSGLLGQDYLDEFRVAISEQCRVSWLQLLAKTRSCTDAICEWNAAGDRRIKVRLTSQTVVIEDSQW